MTSHLLILMDLRIVSFWYLQQSTKFVDTVKRLFMWSSDYPPAFWYPVNVLLGSVLLNHYFWLRRPGHRSDLSRSVQEVFPWEIWFPSCRCNLELWVPILTILSSSGAGWQCFHNSVESNSSFRIKWKSGAGPGLYEGSHPSPLWNSRDL